MSDLQKSRLQKSYHAFFTVISLCLVFIILPLFFFSFPSFFFIFALFFLSLFSYFLFIIPSIPPPSVCPFIPSKIWPSVAVVPIRRFTIHRSIRHPYLRFLSLGVTYKKINSIIDLPELNELLS